MSTKTVLQNTLPGTAEWSMQLPETLHRKLGVTLSPGHEYTAEDCDCKYCLYASQGETRCTAKSCVCLPERLRAGCVTTDELYGRLSVEIEMDTLFPPARKRSYKREVIKTLFVSEGHRDRWRELIKTKKY